MRNGGFQVFEEGLDNHTLRRMRSEALRLLSTAAEVGVSPYGISRRFLRARGSEAQHAFYHGRAIRRLLRDAIGAAVAPTAPVGSYLYYTRPGDHITIHRDDNTDHDLVVITCVADTADSSGDEGMFCVYPHRLAEKIWAIRATPEGGAVKFRLRPGQSLAIFGRWIAHAVLPVGHDQKRIVSVVCYKLAQNMPNQ